MLSADKLTLLIFKSEDELGERARQREKEREKEMENLVVFTEQSLEEGYYVKKSFSRFIGTAPDSPL